MSRISGKSFDINVGDMLINVASFTMDIDDKRTVAMTRGVPNGFVDADVSASGEIELDAANLKLLNDAAASAGSWKQLPLFDINTYANTGTEEMKVEAFGCMIRIANLLDIKPEGGDTHKTKLPFDVTSPDFIRLNGTPYLSDAETKDIR